MKRSTFSVDFSVGFVIFIATILVVAGLFLVGDGAAVFADKHHHLLAGVDSELRSQPFGLPGRDRLVTDEALPAHEQLKNQKIAVDEFFGVVFELVADLNNLWIRALRRSKNQ